jgi:hypothetical protein
MMHFLRSACLLIVLIPFMTAAQAQRPFKVAVAGFYNLENLFDTLDTEGVSDSEFTPAGPKKYNTAIYQDKLTRLATVISEMGTEISPDGPALLGVSEIENRSVLEDLARHPLIAKRQYQIVHYDSKDARGVDVALFYNPKYFTPDTSAALFVELPGGSKDAYFTRDVLYVRGKLDGEPIHLYVNHWPSRSGGEKRSAPARVAAATVCATHMRLVRKTDPQAKILLMGDLNDDPINESVAEVISGRYTMEETGKNDLYNPWYDLYKKGFGTLAYQDAWGLFDQILLSKPWLDKAQSGYFFYKPQIFRKEYMVENMGRYKGYPMRTWDGDMYRAGYSDHFPTYLVLLKRL